MSALAIAALFLTGVAGASVGGHEDAGPATAPHTATTLFAYNTAQVNALNDRGLLDVRHEPFGIARLEPCRDCGTALPVVAKESDAAYSETRQSTWICLGRGAWEVTTKICVPVGGIIAYTSLSDACQGATGKTDCTSDPMCTTQPGCTNGGDCSQGAICTAQDGRCSSSETCTAGGDCSFGDNCTVADVCTCGSQCSSVDDCTNGPLCSTGAKCTGGDVCTSDHSDCTEGNKCSSGVWCTGGVKCTQATDCSGEGTCTAGRMCSQSEDCTENTSGSNCSSANADCTNNAWQCTNALFCSKETFCTTEQGCAKPMPPKGTCKLLRFGPMLQHLVRRDGELQLGFGLLFVGGLGLAGPARRRRRHD